MLDSERTVSIKVVTSDTFFSKFAYSSSYLHLTSFGWKRNFSKTTNITKLNKTIPESSYKVPQLTSK